LGKKSRKRQPKAVSLPQVKKQPRAPKSTAHSGLLCWRFSNCDHAGNWGWPKLSDPPQYKGVIEKLQKFEQKSWDAITKSGSHLIPVINLAKPARNRLKEIHRDDIDELMSFRIGGEKRVWCIKEENVMSILWWDPKHEIYPVPKKHT